MWQAMECKNRIEAGRCKHCFEPKSFETEPYSPIKAIGLFFIKNQILKGGDSFMKSSRDNRFATNKGGIIKAPKSVGSDSPKATVVKGSDLRNGKSGGKR